MDDLAMPDHDALFQMAGRAMAAALSRAPGLVVRFAPGAWRVTADVDIWMANWMVCHGTDAESLALFREGLDDTVTTGHPTCVAVGSAARDQAVPLLAGRSAVSEGADAMMWRDAQPLPPNPKPYPGQVAQVHAGADLTPAFDMVARAFEVDQAGARQAFAGALDDPSMRMFTASSDAIDSVCMTWTEARATYIYLMATDPDRQRRGAGWAVMAGAMEAAIRDGASSFFLEASTAGEGLYRQIGYETYELVDFWEVNPSSSG